MQNSPPTARIFQAANSNDGTVLIFTDGTSGGSGTGGGNLEPRIAKLEADVGHILTYVGEIRDDIRDLRNDDKKLLAGAAFVAIALIGAIWYSYCRLDDKITAASSPIMVKLESIEHGLQEITKHESQGSDQTGETPAVHQGTPKTNRR